MATRLFLPESRLEEWIASGRAELQDEGIRLLPEGVPLSLESACHVRSLVEGRDANEWVGRVKGERWLREAGAEILGTAMIFGDSAYEIVPGFLVVAGEAGKAGEARRLGSA
jgi:hypothetical protein